MHRQAIDAALARRLVAAQFPQWAHLPLHPVEQGGWDNRSFRLGEEMVVRLPSAAEYAEQVPKEAHWLPGLARDLPLPIPEPLALGQPMFGYSWPWSIYRWMEGQEASHANIENPVEFASGLARFLHALQGIDAADGPPPGAHNFERGGSLVTYDAQVRHALRLLEGRIDVSAAAACWEAALSSIWTGPSTWVHGDISPGNLLVRNGRLAAVIDFGNLAVGDPACDLAIAWTFLSGESRSTFIAHMRADAGTWARARGWALWKALIIAAGLDETNAREWKQPFRIIEACSLA